MNRGERFDIDRPADRLPRALSCRTPEHPRTAAVERELQFDRAIAGKRRSGDLADPRGGVRWIIPEKAAYWEKMKPVERNGDSA